MHPFVLLRNRNNPYPNDMKNICITILAILLLQVSCVDDYTDANPPTKLDAPTLRVSASGANQKIITIPQNQYQNNYLAYLLYDGPVDFTVSVIDAPGKVASVSAEPSVPDFGFVVIDDASAAALKGKEVGDFMFTFTPNDALADVSDRSLNLVITVTDSQSDPDGEGGAKTTVFTLPVSLVKCFSEELEEGIYRVTAASGTLDGGAAFTLDDLKADGGVDEILVEVTQDRPGLYTIDEVTGGCWPVYYSGRANPALQVDLCGTSIEGHEGAVTAGSDPSPQRLFTINGTLNPDGTVDIVWSYERVDAATPADPANGSYTLERF